MYKIGLAVKTMEPGAKMHNFLSTYNIIQSYCMYLYGCSNGEIQSIIIICIILDNQHLPTERDDIGNQIWPHLRGQNWGELFLKGLLHEIEVTPKCCRIGLCYERSRWWFSNFSTSSFTLYKCKQKCSTLEKRDGWWKIVDMRRPSVGDEA
jgi:hypothetical protein